MIKISKYITVILYIICELLLDRKALFDKLHTIWRQISWCIGVIIQAYSSLYIITHLTICTATDWLPQNMIDMVYNNCSRNSRFVDLWNWRAQDRAIWKSGEKQEGKADILPTTLSSYNGKFVCYRFNLLGDFTIALYQPQLTIYGTPIIIYISIYFVNTASPEWRIQLVKNGR